MITKTFLLCAVLNPSRSWNSRFCVLIDASGRAASPEIWHSAGHRCVSLAPGAFACYCGTRACFLLTAAVATVLHRDGNGGGHGSAGDWGHEKKAPDEPRAGQHGPGGVARADPDHRG